MAPNFSDPSFAQKNYRTPAPPINEAERQAFVEKLHIPRSHDKADEVTRLIAELLEVLHQGMGEWGGEEGGGVLLLTQHHKADKVTKADAS